MNWKTWVPLVLAIVLGVVAAKAARDVMLKNKGNVANDGKFTKVVVTKGDIQPGSALTAEDLTLTQIEVANTPASSFTTIDQVVGRVSETIMVKGQPVVEAMLAPQGTGSGLQALVPPGMRAVTIEVNEYSGIAGLISPGCRVDVIATINDGNNENRVAKTIVQNVKVTAVGQRTAAAGADAPPPPPGEMFKSVTLLASLEDAEAIELACSTGRPRLVLRGGRDNDIASTVGVSMNDLKTAGTKQTWVPEMVAITPPPIVPTTFPSNVEPTTRPTQAVARRETPRRMIRVIKGGAVSTVSVAMPQEAPAASTETNVAEGATDEEMQDDTVRSDQNDLFGE